MHTQVHCLSYHILLTASKAKSTCRLITARKQMNGSVWELRNFHLWRLCHSENFAVMLMQHPQRHTLQTANVSVVNADKLAVAVRAGAAWVFFFQSCRAAPAASVKCTHVTQLRFSHIVLNISLCKQILSQHVVPDWKVLPGILRWMCFSVSAYLILKAPNQSLSPLMTEAHLALSRLVLKGRKVLGLPQWEVGNWSSEVLYVFVLICSNSLMFVYIWCVC